MSVVVALIENSRVYLGSDSISTNQRGQTWYNRVKIWHSFNNEEILMAGCGDLDVIEFVRHSHGFRNETPTRENINEWLQPLHKEYGDLEKHEWEFIIAGNGKAFIAGNDFLINEITTYDAIGCGRDIALGAMFATQHKRELPEDRIKTAIGAAMMYNVGVGGNIDTQMI